MKTFLLFLFLSCYSVNHSYSQNVEFTYKYGRNYSELATLKKVQTDFVAHNTFPVSLKIVDAFTSRPSAQFQFDILNLVPNWAFGFLIDFSATGGKIHYSDFSGEIRLTQKVKRTLFGLSSSYLIKPENYRVFFSVGSNFLIIKTEFNENEFYAIGAEEKTADLDFKSTSIAIEPSVVTGYKLGFFLFKIQVSYLHDFQDKFYLSDAKNINFIYSDGSNVKSNWSGLRTFLGFGLSF